MNHTDIDTLSAHFVTSDVSLFGNLGIFEETLTVAVNRRVAGTSGGSDGYLSEESPARVNQSGHRINDDAKKAFFCDWPDVRYQSITTIIPGQQPTTAKKKLIGKEIRRRELE